MTVLSRYRQMNCFSYSAHSGLPLKKQRLGTGKTMPPQRLKGKLNRRPGACEPCRKHKIKVGHLLRGWFQVLFSLDNSVQEENRASSVKRRREARSRSPATMIRNISRATRPGKIVLVKQRAGYHEGSRMNNSGSCTRNPRATSQHQRHWPANIRMPKS
jgi:hypothetical protein